MGTSAGAGRNDVAARAVQGESHPIQVDPTSKNALRSRTVGTVLRKAASNVASKAQQFRWFDMRHCQMPLGLFPALLLLALPLKAETVFVVPAATHENIVYGPKERNVLDFWKAHSDKPTPVLLCMHGGGFHAGDKSAYRKEPLVNDCLAHGISVASMNYRYTTTAPLPAAMYDGLRAVQFLRSKAADWNIDPEKIGTTGISAGGNMSVWMACKDDIASPASTDPVARLSSRLTFAMGRGAQTFNDPKLIKQYIYQGVPFFMEKVPPEEATKLQPALVESSAIYLVTKDDPPVYLMYAPHRKLEDAPYPEGASPNDYIHGPAFGAVFKKKYDELGLECVFHFHDNPERPGDELEFILRHFGMK